MSTSAPSYQAEPQIQFLFQLVREVGNGHLQLPRFQRPFVWTDEQRLELLRSIRAGMPIGSIMVWRTNVLDVRCYEELGPYRMKPASGPLRSYIIDGHQRLATLFGALHVPGSDEELPETILYFDLEADDFLLAPRDEEPRPTWMPLRFLLDFPKLLPFQRGLTEDRLIRRSDALVTAFSQYKIPVLAIVTNDLDQVTRTFQRINSQGTVMSEVHMIAALTWSERFDLNERIADWKEQWLSPLGFGALDERIVLHACKAALGFDVYDGDVDAVSRALRDRPEGLEEAGAALVDAVRFLREHCGIYSPAVLPYESHLVPLVEAIRRGKGGDGKIDVDLLRRWFWGLAYSGTRAGLSNLLRILERLRDPQVEFSRVFGKLAPLPKRFDFRIARCKALALRLAARVPGGAELLAREGAAALPHFILDRSSSGDSFQSPVNRILAAPQDAARVRAEIFEACKAKSARGEREEALLRQQAIPVGAADVFEFQDPGYFFHVRLEELAMMENSFMYALGFADRVVPDPHPFPFT